MKLKNKLREMRKMNLHAVAVLLLLLLAVCLLWLNNITNNRTSTQASPALLGKVSFVGEYQIGDGEWHKIVEGEHIPTTEGDVTLKGNSNWATHWLYYQQDRWHRYGITLAPKTMNVMGADDYRIYANDLVGSIANVSLRKKGKFELGDTLAILPTRSLA